ncbi:MAG: protein phosphatase 2C domain-containing protein [Planctomycetes bacterium]|nr:protein phosphatase 2C domain-containing protein [Planctomycetota bacterium]
MADLFGRSIFWPQSGEYANTTNVLTSDDYRDRLDFLAIKTGCSNFALLTDGLERLALSFTQQTPHAPFFEPLFKALRTSGDLAGLSEGLRKFLASESVQLRSDDDKTLIIATRHDTNDVA